MYQHIQISNKSQQMKYIAYENIEKQRNQYPVVRHYKLKLLLILTLLGK